MSSSGRRVRCFHHSAECAPSHRECVERAGDCCYAARRRRISSICSTTRNSCSIRPIISAAAFRARTISSNRATTSSPIRCADSRCAGAICIPDIINAELPLDNRRSPGYRRIEPMMAGNRFYQFIGQYETGRYSKAHKHHSTAVLICLKGRGYTYTWPDALGPTPWRDGKSRQGAAAGLRIWRDRQRRADERRLVSPAFRRGKRRIARARLARPEQSSRAESRTARRSAEGHLGGRSRQRRRRDSLSPGRPRAAAGI